MVALRRNPLRSGRSTYSRKPLSLLEVEISRVWRSVPAPLYLKPGYRNQRLNAVANPPTVARGRE
jgi:hypothetical protein